ncbi:hypothetical protein [Streptomyces mirabilis]|uniref:hypothetical protein n=1 Tax=Streptomyces mirabilis TaxID=68239 RepID=UPI0036D8CD59
MGDALLIHPKGRYDDRAAAFAAGIAEDPLHTLVVVDLPADALATEWEAVARLLSGARYGSLRLVFGRGSGDDIRTACRLLAERLEREVLAPDGDLVPTLTGGLFVPGDDAAAWLRFRPSRDPEPTAQRYPKPHWEFSAPTRTGPVGTHTVAQPVPAGVWLRRTDHDPLAARHQRAVEATPTDPHLFLLVLGSPGTPPLSLDDVTRFWNTVLPGVRPAVRFVLYGSLDTPAGHAPAQTLADTLNHPVTLYDALPYAEPDRRPVPAESTYLPSGSVTPGAVPSPGPVPDDPATPGVGAPTAVPSPPPIRTESGAGTPAPDSGASTTASRNASTPDTVTPVQEETGATDLPEALTTPDDTDLSEAPTVRNDGAGPPPDAEPTTSGAADLEEAPTIRNARRTPRNKTPDPTPAPDQAPDSALPPAPSPSPAPATDPAHMPDPASEPPVTPHPVPTSTSTSTSVPAEAPVPASTPAPPSIPQPDSTPAPVPAPTLSAAPAQRLAPPVAPRFRLESGAPESEISEVGDVGAPVAVDPQVATTGTGPEPGTTSVAGGAVGGPGVRVQPVPRAAACALPPERGIAQEREWLRRTLSEQYNAVAGSVSRVMSESPGLRGGSRTEVADALTELVAVRLYLSGDSRQADAVVREATAGPHVPLARCVTAGLRRLPSYRGPALLRTRLGEAERAWYREGRLATEWAFCHARTSLHPGPSGSGATDVLIWSMTARRTSSLDPAVPDRVLFLPGTAFKVLRTEGSVVLMRELSPSETAHGGRNGQGGQRDVPAKLDEIAVKGLEKILDALERTGTDAAAGSADPPGLIVTPRAVRTEGAKP